ncbi:MAG: hexapeptide transferase [Thermoanaerobacterales bacterium]|nr:hexapeptide transferase [Thermoanaerobacterales bacterium]
MLRPSPLTEWSQDSRMPAVAGDAFADPAAVLIGDVRIESRVIVCPGAVLRADEGSPIIIRRDTNVQDGVIMHALLNSFIEVGPSCCIAHGAILHGPCVIGEGSFVGFRATILSSRLGRGCFIGHGALVLNVDLPRGTFVPPGMTVATPGDVEHLPQAGESQQAFTAEVLRVNRELRRGYLALEEESLKPHAV